MRLRPLVPVLVAFTIFGCQTESTVPAPQTQAPADDEQTPVDDSAVSSSTSDVKTSTDSDDDADGVSIDADQPFVSFPATGIKILRPEGFDDAENFHGFQQPATGASVLISTIPGPYSETTRAFTAEQLQKRRMTLRDKQTVAINEETGVLLNVQQEAYGTEFYKWILAFGTENETRVITATFPASEEAKLSERLKSVVLSARVDDKATPPPEPDVGFTLAPSDKLKTTNINAVGKMLLYTKDGIVPAKSPTDPLFVAAPSLSTVPIADERQFAVNRVYQVANTRIGSLKSNNEITIDGLSGYEIEAVGEYSETATPMAVYQVVLFDEGSYILMQGLARVSEADQYLPEFKRLARSLKQNEN